MPRGKDLTTTELEEIRSFLKEGLTYAEVGELVGRTGKSIQNIAQRKGWTKGRYRDAASETPSETISDSMKQTPIVPVKEKTLKNFSFREIIKYLWDNGYRWQDMYCLVKQKVNVEDIIKNG